MVALPYGRVPYPLDLGARPITVVEPPPLPPRRDLATLLEDALDRPIGRPRVETMVGARARVTVIVSDVTRDEPRAAFLTALRRRLPSARWTLAIATGTHGPCGPSRLGISDDILQSAAIVDHDGHSDTDLVTLGTTRRGTPMRVHRCVVDTDLVVATGCIRPHYFAGFGAGVKAIFPGLGAARDVRINHRWKTEPGARAGIIEGNPCREDLEEAVALLTTPTFLVNGVCATDGEVYAAVAGDPIAAFRRGAEVARPWFTVAASRAPIVIASDVLPVTASLYQSAKIAAAVAPLVEPSGVLVIASECGDGIGPLATVNEAIFRTGILPRLAPGVALRLVSALPKADVEQTLVAYSETISEAIQGYTGQCLVIPRASQLLFQQ